MDSLPKHPVADLGWSHVGIGLTFIAFNSIISQALQLHIGASLVSAALRCVVQLTLVATILQRVFAAENFWAVVGIACKYVVVCLATVSLL
jgi:ABC-type iron transport system FetAB permease component